MTCYVCMADELAPRAECLCTDRFMHTNCLRNVIENTGQLHCSVCLAPYDATIKRSKKIIVTEDGFACILIVLANVLVLSVGIVVVYFHFSLSTVPFSILTSIIVFTFLCTVIITMWWLHVVRSYNIQFLKIKTVIKVVSIPERIAL